MSVASFAPTASAFGKHRVIDVDTHLSEPHDLWISRAPAAFRDRVPQVKDVDGTPCWVIDGDKPIYFGSCPTSVVLPDGAKSRGMDWINFRMEDVHPSSSRIKERLQFMDSQNISAQILYPNVLGFGGQHSALVDFELRLVSVQIFNDAMAQYQVDSGQRIFPMALMPWWDAALTVREAQRCHAMGLRGININTDPQLHMGLSGEMLPDLADPYWNPIWEVCSDLDIPINFHIGSSSSTTTEWIGGQGWPSMSREMRGALGSTLLYHQNARVLGNLICSGVVERYPGLKFVSVESGIGWIPNFLETLDYQMSEMTAHTKLQRRPSEYFPTNFYGCFWFERRNISQMIKIVGVDNVMFETDFPHPTCLLPLDDVASALGGLTFDEQAKVLNGNAAKVYNIQLN